MGESGEREGGRKEGMPPLEITPTLYKRSNDNSNGKGQAMLGRDFGMAVITLLQVPFSWVP
jgi:hypothetical protein